MSDLYTDVRLLTDIVRDLDEDVRTMPADQLESNLIAYAAVEEARRNLGIVAHDLEQKLAADMPRSVVVEGVGVFERHRKTARTQWDKEDLLRAVLDSRVFDRTTGELREETPLEKVLAVWNLPAPRKTALQDRGIDADQFCHTEDAGQQVRLIA
jgi:hypothetical protein